MCGFYKMARVEYIASFRAILTSLSGWKRIMPPVIYWLLFCNYVNVASILQLPRLLFCAVGTNAERHPLSYRLHS